MVELQKILCSVGMFIWIWNSRNGPGNWGLVKKKMYFDLFCVIPYHCLHVKTVIKVLWRHVICSTKQQSLQSWLKKRFIIGGGLWKSGSIWFHQNDGVVRENGGMIIENEGTMSGKVMKIMVCGGSELWRNQIACVVTFYNVSRFGRLAAWCFKSLI